MTAAAGLDLGLLGAGDDVARGEFHASGGVVLHEAEAVGVDDVRAFAASRLGEQDAGALQSGRVELDELHVLQRDAGAVGHDHAVAGGGEGVGGDAEGASVAASAEHDGLGRDRLDLAGEDVVGDEYPGRRCP